MEKSVLMKTNAQRLIIEFVEMVIILMQLIFQKYVILLYKNNNASSIISELDYFLNRHLHE